ncbi:hypothetical protein IJ182_07310 [bacterium]|nr:hypothetical protein [bacterium]
MTKINNNKYPIYNSQTAKAVRKAKKVAKSKEQVLQGLTKASSELLCTLVERDVPEHGPIQKLVVVKFDIPDSNNVTLLSVENSAENKLENRDLIVGVRHKLRDRLTSNILVNRKNKKEILQYLRDPKNQPEIIDSIKNLSKKTDDYYNTL